MTDVRLDTTVARYLVRLKAAIDAMPIERITAMGEILYRAYRHNQQVFIIGNGGSAATASHMACDLGMNTTAPNRPRFRVVSLTDNTPLLSALANDHGYECVFTEQLTNLVRPGDVLVSISGSGCSSNIVGAMRYARGRSATNIALLGFDGGEAIALADEYVLVDSSEYGIIEDLHLAIDHMLTEYFKRRLQDES